MITALKPQIPLFTKHDKPTKPTWLASALSSVGTTPSASALSSANISSWEEQQLMTECEAFRSFYSDLKTYDIYIMTLLTSGSTLWMIRTFLDTGALEGSSWVVSVSATTAASSSSRGLLDMEDVPGAAETWDDMNYFCILNVGKISSTITALFVSKSKITKFVLGLK